ncbi:hypothetical protein NZD89_27365 [Alicyclobacillus fastidiosus]|uniref:Uncharacterized protein n=1 Tax=Alicyclobacillus fastidiosus TaxID=392011 RepID=A0ABY6ZGM3_9BACL|nr:hypothetical protein [Alicyclobacillus fastidiosus]WAH41875.1 hypothetical protein NZD89_27365 [Alicyclobacillus fastidiosus]GMA63585.1 hypothetical protein GCM10025859_40250 [Alicyclobacillus fastidiosus]
MDALQQEARLIRMLMERMRDEVASEVALQSSATRTGEWSSRLAGRYGATLYQRARQIVRAFEAEAGGRDDGGIEKP